MELEEFLEMREIQTNKMNERELFYTLKGLVNAVGELNSINLFLNVRKNRLIEDNLLGKHYNSVINSIKNEMKDNSNEIGRCLSDIKQIEKELDHRGIEVPELI